jgi:hypothetical protein
MRKRSFINKLHEEGFLLFPCDEFNKPMLNVSNFRNEIIQFNEEMNLKIQNGTFNYSQNLAMLCGNRNNLVVVDVDKEFRGTSIWKDWLNRYNGGKDIETIKVETAGGGLHYYFQYQHEKFYHFESIYRPTFQTYGIAGIDLIAENGYVILPFTVRRNGNMYALKNYSSSLQIKEQIIPMPDWLFKLFESTKESMKNNNLKVNLRK